MSCSRITECSDFFQKIISSKIYTALSVYPRLREISNDSNDVTKSRYISFELMYNFIFSACTCTPNMRKTTYTNTILWVIANWHKIGQE